VTDRTKGRAACGPGAACRPGPSGRLWVGLALLALGVLWTLDNLDILESDPIVHWWPVILIAIGITHLTGGRGRVRPVAGLMWLALGGLALAHNLAPGDWDIWQFWPVVLVLLGGSMVWRSFGGPRPAGPGGWGPGRWGPMRFAPGKDDPAAPPSDAPGADTFSSTAIWAGVDRKVTSQAFRGGDITAIMGGGEIDLRSARPVPGGAAVEVFILMGGVDVYVPQNWQVVNQISAFLGGVEDSRKAAPAEGGNVLYLRGTVVMGAVEIQN
jgi:hypothetical protein